jgi:hypothetical protein
MKFEKVILTNDYLRVNEAGKNLFETPFKENLRWIKVLIGDAISDALKIDKREFFTADESGSKSIRWRIYNDLCLPFSVSSWSFVYEQVEISDSVKKELADRLTKSLIVSFESSPALLKTYNEIGVSYIDIAIHPIRFLDDYVFAIRTNIDEVRKKIADYKLKDELCRAKARIYQAKSARLTVFQKLPACSVLFIGQMDQDSSLIEKQRMIDLDYIKCHLEELSSLYPNVYYKKHPHNKHTKLITEFIEEVERIEVLDCNIYDALGSGVFSKIISISSGVLHEARIFGYETKRISKARDYYEKVDEPDELAYLGVMRLPMIKEFWESLFFKAEYVDNYVYDPYEGGMQKSLNKVWGAKI